MKKGQVICFEGIDAAGKRTQSELLMNELVARGIKSKVYSYPDYSSEYGKIIHGYLHGKVKLGRTEHFLLFLIDIMKDGEALRKDLERGTVVIMDRYIYTALAYICPSGLDYDRAKGLVDLMGFVYPSVVLYLDIPTQLTSKRKAKLDKFESDRKFLGQVKKVYERMIEEQYGCNAWKRIDARLQIREVHNHVMKELGKSGIV